MGKANFAQIYNEAAEELQERPTIKISGFSDYYNRTSNFAGMIIYHTSGQFRWYQEQGCAAGYNGKAFYVLIMCTDTWPAEALRMAGQGRVHDYLYRKYFEEDFDDANTCCGGFAVLANSVRYSSIWLNEQEGSVQDEYGDYLTWQSDGSKMLSELECRIADAAVSAWKNRGPGAVASVPQSVHLEAGCDW